MELTLVVVGEPTTVDDFESLISAYPDIDYGDVAACSVFEPLTKMLGLTGKTFEVVSTVLCEWIKARANRRVHIKYHSDGYIHELEISSYSQKQVTKILKELTPTAVFVEEGRESDSGGK
ncbi:hypothetical protein [Enterobacter kobei]|uniref:hypothetical protein n=1 Tax=Enterobacter kobei TaxID=208224 RepID=UPI003CECCE54